MEKGNCRPFKECRPEGPKVSSQFFLCTGLLKFYKLDFNCIYVKGHIEPK
jgi:hypothetical protein